MLRTLALLPLAALALAGGDLLTAPKKSLATITVADLTAHSTQLASPELEGRDSPSWGLEQAAVYIAGRMRDAGVKPLDAVGAGDSAYLWPFSRVLPKAEPSKCSLALDVAGEAKQSFVLGEDFVPIPDVEGEASGPLVFVGFGINAAKEHFTDAKGKDLAGAIALLVEGEPRHSRLFDGPEVSNEADLWEKLGDFKEAGVAGVVVVRRPLDKPKTGKAAAEPQLSMRATWASWAGEDGSAHAGRPGLPPAIEVTRACAAALLGEDVEALAQKIDKSGKSLRKKPAGRTVTFGAKTLRTDVTLHNVIGTIAGSDAALAGEYVVIGAHYDHVGVDSRGRIGCGADDNASGTAALIELAQALALDPPRRSVLLCAFAAEEDGLLGSKALCARPPVPVASMVAMLNMDMIGRGEVGEVAVLGVRQNPDLEQVLERAKRLAPTGIQEITVKKGEDLFQRSDHYSFHEVDVPVLFFFEGLPIDKNKDYHTWRDTLEHLDFEKMKRTTLLVFNTAWILANDDARPPKPRASR